MENLRFFPSVSPVFSRIAMNKAKKIEIHCKKNEFGMSACMQNAIVVQKKVDYIGYHHHRHHIYKVQTHTHMRGQTPHINSNHQELKFKQNTHSYDSYELQSEEKTTATT